MYLYNVYPVTKKPPLDSAAVNNGTFTFHFKPDTIFETKLVYIVRDKNDPRSGLGIINPVTSKDGKLNLYGDFLMETGTIELTGDLEKSRGITLTGGPQNQFRFQNVDLPFNDISSIPAKHQAQVNSFVQKLNAMPNAYWCMFALSNLKFQVNNDELRKIYNTFDEQSRNGYSGRKIKEFLDTRPDEKALRPNNMLTTENGKHIPMIDTTKKLNMVVFWASWCGPCRQEIPSLKKIAATIKDDRFRMVSVSIDDDKDRWKKAMGEEQMPWQQLSIDQAIMERVKMQYNLNYIPQIFFIDGKRNLLTKLGGFEKENEDKILATINGYLK
uniref:thioredoxin-like domain-containing protein n=1 Tax=Mucilaginibacter mali TaxID=2740462 RepID=UPI003743B5B8